MTPRKSTARAAAATVALGAVAAYILSTQTKRKFSSPKDVALQEFDFVIVGGGTAALVLANRLTEREDFSVLVLEAGFSGMDVPYSRIPSAIHFLQRGKHDWTYTTVPQEGCLHREMPWTRTKMLGGCSSGNAMMFHLGAPEDWDRWEREGAEGWGYSSMKEYIRKFEKFVGNPEHPIPMDERGTDGPVEVGYFNHVSPMGEAFLQTCEELGIQRVDDVNTSKGTLGATRVPTYIDSAGKRVSTESAYLTHDVLARKNLTVAVGAVVTKVRIAEENGAKRAIGVEFAEKKGGPTYFVSAKKEVILCGGAVNTPQTLMLSGIGPAQELKKHNIPIVQSLPGVGRNLADHIAFNHRFPAKDGYSLRKWLRPATLWENVLKVKAFGEFITLGTGPITTCTQEAFAFVRLGGGDLLGRGKTSEDNTSGPDAPDIEIFSSPVAWKDHGHGDYPVGDCATVSFTLLQPTSKGTITLRSSNPWDKPIVDPKYLTTDHDVELMLRGLRMANKIAYTKPLSNILDLDSEDPLFDLDVRNKSDEELVQLIRSRSETLYHPSCTVRMAPLEADGVVDPKLRVYGITGLRVVDASVQTQIISGHTTGPVIAIAEKASDLIKSDW